MVKIREEIYEFHRPNIEEITCAKETQSVSKRIAVYPGIDIGFKNR